MAVSRGFFGSHNDETIVKYEPFSITFKVEKIIMTTNVIERKEMVP